MKIPFGAQVTFTATLERRPLPKVQQGQIWTTEDWLPTSHEPKLGIYLGERTVMRGYTERSYDEGPIFHKTGHKRVALICMNERTNPVYVPLDQIQADESTLKITKREIGPLKEEKLCQWGGGKCHNKATHFNDDGSVFYFCQKHALLRDKPIEPVSDLFTQLKRVLPTIPANGRKVTSKMVQEATEEGGAFPELRKIATRQSVKRRYYGARDRG